MLYFHPGISPISQNPPLSFSWLDSYGEMDGGEAEMLNRILMSNSDTACTHTHTCNPPGPAAASHTHTCYHTHTQVFAAGDPAREVEEEEEGVKKPRKARGNREAVRKYREKKKAHAVYLEEEVKKLRLANQQLLRRLQGQAALEAEAARLRSLLVGLRAKIDGELGVYPFRKPCDGVGLQCGTKPQCVGGTAEVFGWDDSCMPPVVDCRIRTDADER